MAKNAENDSPLMRQHAQMKRKFPDAMLLFRVGDFYETFGEDARKASNILGITLTRKASGGGGYTDLAGIPYHAIDQYLPRRLLQRYGVGREGEQFPLWAASN